MSYGVTPDRKTLWQADIPETITLTPPWGVRRRGGEIAQGRANGTVDESKHQGVKLWATGAWTFEPLQTQIASIQEVTPTVPMLIISAQADLANFVASGFLAVENLFHKGVDLPGLVSTGETVISGGAALVKKIAAGTSFSQPIASGVPGILTGPNGTDPGIPNIGLDPVLESKNPYPANQGFFLNWSNPGKDTDYPAATIAFRFATFGIVFTGSGTADLYEYVTYTDGSGKGWQKRDSWRYARAGQIAGTAHSIACWPHSGPLGERYIVFSNNQVDYAQVSSSYTRTTATSVTPGDHLYTVAYDSRYQDPAPGNVTASGPIGLDIRQDLRPVVQISTLGWPTTGLLIDEAAALPPDASGADPALYPVRLFADTVAPSGTSIISTLIDSVSGAAFDPTIHSSPAAKFVFTGDGTNTPILWGYRMNRDAVGGLVAPGAFTGGSLRGVSLLGYNGDPSQQSGSLTIKDPAGQLTRFQQRGEFSVAVQIQHVEGGRTFTTPVWRGYINDLSARKRPGRAGRAFPSVAWFDYDAPLVGVWMRLAEQTTGPMLYEQFYQDPSSPFYASLGRPQAAPVKVTDVIRYLLISAGFSPSQVNIVDLDMRLWSGTGEKIDEEIIAPGVDYAEMALRLCRNYLGCFLMYDETIDQWSLLFATPPGAAPLYSFTTLPPGGGRIPVAAAYGPGLTFITEISYTVIKPAYNVVHVSAAIPQSGAKTQQIIERRIYNFDSFQVPGASHYADPSNPDYLGRMKLTETHDASLLMPTPALTQQAVDWTARRIFDFACHAQRLAHFTSPLIFVADPITGRWRLPRFMDPVLINGAPYLIKAVHADYRRDNKQVMNVEAIQPMAGQYVPPGMSSVAFQRRAVAKHSLRTGGSYTDSNLFGTLGVPPHAEHRFRNLPINTDHQQPLQNPANGSFYAQAGYDPL